MLKLDRITLVIEGQSPLKDFSLEVAPGDWILLEGGSTCQLITMLLEGKIFPTGGHFYYQGVDTQSYTASKWASFRKRELIMIRATKGLMNHFDVEKNIQMQLKYAGVYPTKWKRQSQKVLKELELLPLRNRAIETLNSLERWQVKLAKALIVNPKYIVIEGLYEGLEEVEAKGFLAFCKEKIPEDIGVILCTKVKDQDEGMTPVKL